MKRNRSKIIRRAMRFEEYRRYFERYPERRSTYIGQLHDPSWRKHRMEIIVRDKFTCQKCGMIGDVDEDPFTVKRTIIHPNEKRKLWEIPKAEFATLCHNCAEEE